MMSYTDEQIRLLAENTFDDADNELANAAMSLLADRTRLKAEVAAFFDSMEVRAYELVLLSDKEYNRGDLVRADGYAKAARVLREEIDSARAKKLDI